MSYLNAGAILGFSAKETMLIAPGIIFDMIKLRSKKNGGETDADEVYCDETGD